MPLVYGQVCEAVGVSVNSQRYEPAMLQALQLAAQAGRCGEIPVGAVVLSPQLQVLAQAANARETSCDPSAHAEILALRAAALRVGSSHLCGCTLVVNLEPCLMCAGAIQLARLARVVFATWAPKTGACGSVRDVLRDPRANHQVEVIAGIAAQPAQTLLRDFFAARR